MILFKKEKFIIKVLFHSRADTQAMSQVNSFLKKFLAQL